MKNFLLTISFRGTNYHGSQFQNNSVSVMEVFQRSLKKVIRSHEGLKACSRTDAGVHANCFCISMKLENDNINIDGVVKGLNSVLPSDIAVISYKEVDEEFHARYMSKGKRYIYKIWNSDVKDPFIGDLAYQYKYDIDIDFLNKQAKYFIGEHDFKSFTCQKCTIEDTVRTIYDCGVKKEGNMITIYIEGNGFLYNMVRIIVGTLIDISAGFIEKDSIPDIFQAKDREKAGFTAPAWGLYLDKVFY